MSPYETIKALYDLRPEPQPFEAYVRGHLERGFVFSTPDFFIMGLPTTKEWLRSKGHSDTSLKADTWFIFAMAGDTSKAWSILPYELPFLAWERDRPHGKELHIYPIQRIRALCTPSA
jgi:hypothetical protein